MKYLIVMGTVVFACFTAGAAFFGLQSSAQEAERCYFNECEASDVQRSCEVIDAAAGAVQRALEREPPITRACIGALIGSNQSLMRQLRQSPLGKFGGESESDFEKELCEARFVPGFLDGRQYDCTPLVVAQCDDNISPQDIPYLGANTAQRISQLARRMELLVRRDVDPEDIELHCNMQNSLSLGTVN